MKSLLPLRDGREYGIPTKTQILMYDIMVCGEKRRMPNLPIEILFIQGNHINEAYPYLSNGILQDVHLFSEEAKSWELGGCRRLFSSECVDFNISTKEVLRNDNYLAEDVRREEECCNRKRKSNDLVDPLDNPYYNDALDMDQQSPDFWDSI